MEKFLDLLYNKFFLRDILSIFTNGIIVFFSIIRFAAGSFLYKDITQQISIISNSEFDHVQPCSQFHWSHFQLPITYFSVTRFSGGIRMPPPFGKSILWPLACNVFTPHPAVSPSQPESSQWWYSFVQFPNHPSIPSNNRWWGARTILHWGRLRRRSFGGGSRG